MGFSFVSVQNLITTMKVLLIVALALAAVMAEPEPDASAAADAWYGYYGHPSYYGGYGRGYYGYGGYASRYYGYGGYYGHPYGGYRYFGKRSADAEPVDTTDTVDTPTDMAVTTAVAIGAKYWSIF